MLRALFIIFAILFLPTAVGAETIYLKNGQVIKSKITKDTGYSIQIMEGGFPKTFNRDEIDRVEPDQPADSADAYLTAGTKEELTAAKRELIFRLMEANGARDSMNQVFNQIISQVPAENRDKYKELLRVDEIITRLAPIYAKYYTTADLKQLIEFYKSPLGQKHIQLTPSLMQDSMVETVKYFQEKVPQENKK